MFDYDDFESYGYDQMEQEYFYSHPEIYSQEAVDSLMETAIKYRWIE